ncbi:sodium/glucose cotransporter 4-like [Physella acuta]|uniref:sodium/glucose cotransporter 4-like n=1 Tax=Physella acuta TaxID=109671 RepID=UPI0027DBEFC1|nr:sodium/glucose cotransporter 4-like [Physella acuta]
MYVWLSVGMYVWLSVGMYVWLSVGGLTAVIYTDTLQAVILLIGATILAIIVLVDVGGWYQFMAKYAHAASNLTLSSPGNYTCGLPRQDYKHIWRNAVTGDIPWTGAVFGLTVNGLRNWCMDQIMVQRCLSAKNISHSKGGCMFAAVLKLSPFFLWIIPGMISRIYFPDEVACSDPATCKAVCGNEAGCSNIAYPLLVLRKMPTGLKGIMLAALLSALMSSLTSIFNSASSMFTMDIWTRYRRRASQKELMVVGRVCVLVLIAFSIVWIPVIQSAQGGQLWTYLQTMASCVSPPFCWVFLLALFWKGTTEQGAFWGLVISTCVGLVRMVLEFVYPAPLCGSFEPDTRPLVLRKVHFFHFAIILSGVSIISIVGISLMTKPRPPEKLHRVTWWTRNDTTDPEDSESEVESEAENEEKSQSNTIETLNELAEPKRRSLRVYFYNWICGIDDTPKPKLTVEEKLIIKKKMKDIGEDPSSRKITAFVAVFVAAITTFLLGFFN